MVRSVVMRTAALLAALSTSAATCANKEWGQCGGSTWSGDACCPDYDECKVVNSFYSQCQPVGICLNPMYGQCGGYDHQQPPRPWNSTYHHLTCCPPSFDCIAQDKWYSQCVYDNVTSSCSGAYKQCGGQGYKGPACCIPGFKCTPDATNPKYYSGCQPEPFCSNARFGQCGGVDSKGHPWTKQYKHDDCCPDGFGCDVVNKFYSQCRWSNATAA